MDEIESSWQDVLSTSMLGTGRRTEDSYPIPGNLGELIARLDESNPERFMLGVSAAIALYRKAGWLPPMDPLQPPSACEPDKLPRCTQPAASQLASILSGQYGEILGEWLDLAAKNKKRVPEELLPDLLDWGAANPDQIEMLLPVIDQRGHWLASKNPAWAVIEIAALVECATNELLEEIWQTEKHKNRRVLLRLLRKRSAKLGRDLVATTWFTESAEDRTEFLAAFEINLSMEDEQFLEAALDDRSKHVRQTAAMLLARLPQSRLVKETTRHILQLLRLETGRWPLRREHIELTFPEEFDAEMSRNGLEARPPRGQTVGDKAWWLQQMLSIVPPSVFCQTWEKSADEILDIAADRDWRQFLHEAWITATLQHREASWAEALLKRYPQHSTLLDILEPSKRDVFIQTLLRSNPKDGIVVAIGYHHPWSLALTRLVLSQLRRHYFTNQQTLFFTQFRQELLEIGQFMHPGSISDVERLLQGKDGDESTWDRAVQSLLQLLEFRHHMIEELTL